MTDYITVSRANIDDLEEILTLQKLAFISEAEIYNDFNLEPLKQSIDSIREDFKTHIFLKTVSNNIIVGSVKGRETIDGCWIGKLIVHPEYQNKGIGKKLMHEIESIFHESKQFLLYTGYKSDKNIHLYESLGYVKHELMKDEKTPDVHLVKLIKENK